MRESNMSTFKINGIKTKIINPIKEQWDLVLSDPSQAKDIICAMEEELGLSHRKKGFSNIPIASISKHWDERWEILDWRLAPRRETLKSIICPIRHAHCPIAVNTIDSEEYQTRTADVKQLSYSGHDSDSTGKQILTADWPTFRGAHMTEEGYDERLFSPSFHWKYRESRKYLADLKEFWDRFRGNSILEAKKHNPFDQSDLNITIMGTSTSVNSVKKS